jgi:hypothetical protein
MKIAALVNRLLQDDLRVGNIHHDLGRCFELYQNFLASGTMLSD